MRAKGGKIRMETATTATIQTGVRSLLKTKKLPKPMLLKLKMCQQNSTRSLLSELKTVLGQH